MSITDVFDRNKSYINVNNKFVFKQLEESEINDGLDKLKSKFKKFYKLYSFLINVVSPVYVGGDLKRFLDTDVKDKELIVNIGSGNSKISDSVYNVDIFAYDNVDIVCDISDLPFKDNSIDVIINIAVLEHVPEPQKVIDEIYRVLKSGGVIYTIFPFMQGFHASPYDYTRVTKEGIKKLHKEFDIIEVKPFGGPTSGMLWILQEWMAIVLSFGNKKLHMFFYLLTMVVTFPIKFLDFFLINNRFAENISSGFVFIGKKK